MVAASQQDLAEPVEPRRFREDLYFRICQTVVEGRPRQRGRMRRSWRYGACGGLCPMGAGAWQEALAAIRAYAWPGNVRELKNAIARVAVMAAAPYVTAKDPLLHGKARGC